MIAHICITLMLVAVLASTGAMLAIVAACAMGGVGRRSI